jgi:hypothetical protein
MAHRMVSARNEPCVSAAVSNVNSVPIISVDSQSITSDSHTMTLDGPAAELGAKSMTLPGAGGSSSSTHNSHTRHDSYFFQDGNVTFLVGDALWYCMRPVQ